MNIWSSASSINNWVILYGSFDLYICSRFLTPPLLIYHPRHRISLCSHPSHHALDQLFEQPFRQHASRKFKIFPHLLYKRAAQDQRSSIFIAIYPCRCRTSSGSTSITFGIRQSNRHPTIVWRIVHTLLHPTDSKTNRGHVFTDYLGVNIPLTDVSLLKSTTRRNYSKLFPSPSQ